MQQRVYASARRVARCPLSRCYALRLTRRRRPCRRADAAAPYDVAAMLPRRRAARHADYCRFHLLILPSFFTTLRPRFFIFFDAAASYFRYCRLFIFAIHFRRFRCCAPRRDVDKRARGLFAILLLRPPPDYFHAADAAIDALML